MTVNAGQNASFTVVAANTAGTATSNAATLTVTLAPGCSYGLSTTAAVVGASGGTGSVTVTPSSPNCSWTAVSNAGFITVTGGAFGAGTGTVTYSVTSLATGVRTGTLSIGGTTVTITQSVSCVYAISPVSASVGVAGGSGSSAVSSLPGCAWTAASNNAFVAVTGGSPGSGNGTMLWAVATNAPGTGVTSTAARIGTVTVAGQTFSIAQSGSIPCSFALLASQASFSNAAATGSVGINTVTHGFVFSASIDLQGNGRPDIVGCHTDEPPNPIGTFPCRVLRPQPDGSVIDVTRQLLGSAPCRA